MGSPPPSTEPDVRHYRIRLPPVDSKLTCPVYVAHDLSGSFLQVFQPRAEILSRTVALGSTIGDASDRWVGPGWAPPASISWPSAW